MKKKLAILLGVIALSSMSFGATTKTGASSIENSLNNLEKQLTDLQKMEDQKYAQEEAKAAAAQQKIDEYSKLQLNQQLKQAFLEKNLNQKFQNTKL